MSDGMESCANCGADVDKEPYVLCDECEDGSGADALRAQLAAMTERAERVEEARERMKRIAEETSALNIEIANERDVSREERDAAIARAEKAEAEILDHKEFKAIAAFFSGPDEESVNSAKLARKVLAERDAALAKILELEANEKRLIRFIEAQGERYGAPSGRIKTWAEVSALPGPVEDEEESRG